MSKIKDELIGAQDAVRTVADEALKKMELTELQKENEVQRTIIFHTYNKNISEKEKKK